MKICYFVHVLKAKKSTKVPKGKFQKINSNLIVFSRYTLLEFGAWGLEFPFTYYIGNFPNIQLSGKHLFL